MARRGSCIGSSSRGRARDDRHRAGHDGEARLSLQHLGYYVVTTAPEAGRGLVAALSFAERPLMEPIALFVDPGTRDLVIFDADRREAPSLPHLRFV